MKRYQTKTSGCWPEIPLFLILGTILVVIFFFTNDWLAPEESVSKSIYFPKGKKENCQLLEKLKMKELTKIPKEECQKCNGKWGVLSMDVSMVGCNPQTSDKGKNCTDKSQCIGICFGEGTNSNSGRCSEYKYSLGCSSELIKGKKIMVCRD